MCATIIEPHPALLTPFAILLLSIAIFPLILRQRWERHYQKLCALLAATTCGYYIFALHGAARVHHAAGEYASFIIVVGTFFVVAGAIHLHIPRPASRSQMSCFCLAEASWQILSARLAHRCFCSTLFCI